MCEAVKKYAKKYAKDVKMEEKIKTILAMQEEKMSVETIAKCVRLSVDEVKAIIDSQLATV